MTKTKKKNRKDSKGKVLRTGESERSNGTYMYRYVPKIRGRSVNSPEKKDNRITIYAKTLPELRQKELQITQDIIEEIDTVMKLGMAHPMGPLQLADFIGLDVCLAILNVMHDGFKNPKYAPNPLLVNMVTAGKKGIKSGEGFYDYSESKKAEKVSKMFLK